MSETDESDHHKMIVQAPTHSPLPYHKKIPLTRAGTSNQKYALTRCYEFCKIEDCCNETCCTVVKRNLSAKSTLHQERSREETTGNETKESEQLEEGESSALLREEGEEDEEEEDPGEEDGEDMNEIRARQLQEAGLEVDLGTFMVAQLNLGHTNVREQYFNKVTKQSTALQWGHYNPRLKLSNGVKDKIIIQNLPILPVDEENLQIHISPETLKLMYDSDKTNIPNFIPTSELLIRDISLFRLQLGDWPAEYCYDFQIRGKDRSGIHLMLSNENLAWVIDEKTTTKIKGVPVYTTMKIQDTQIQPIYSQVYRQCLLQQAMKWGHWPWEQIQVYAQPHPTLSTHVRVLIHDNEIDREFASSPLAFWLIEFMLHHWIDEQGEKSLSSPSSLVQWNKHEPYYIVIDRDYLKVQWNACQDFFNKLNPFVDMAYGLTINLHVLRKPSEKMGAVDTKYVADWGPIGTISSKTRKQYQFGLTFKYHTVLAYDPVQLGTDE